MKALIGGALVLSMGWMIVTTAWAGVAGTPFESLAVEVDARFPTVEGRQKRALKIVTRELQRVDRGLKRDLRSARKVTKKIDRAFPDDATFGDLLDTTADGFAALISNRIFGAEQTLADAESATRRERAAALLVRARSDESAAATSEARKERIRLMAAAARRTVRAEKLIAYVAPPPPPDPTGNPVGDVVGQVGTTVNGVTNVTVTVDAASRADNSHLYFDVTATPNASQITEISFAWRTRQINFTPRVPVGPGPDDVAVTIRRGSTVFDQNTSGEVWITQLKFSNSTGSMTGTFRASASAANGQQITVTGTIAIQHMPYTYAP